MKKWVSLIMAAVISMGLFTACSNSYEYTLKEKETEEIDFTAGFLQSTEDAYTVIDETGRLILKANFSNGELIIADKASGKEWYSNPADKGEDTFASGFNRVGLYSQVLVSYSTSVSVAMNVGSYNGSVTKKGLTYRVDDGKVIFQYTFEKEGFVIPVRYSLDGGTFIAEILTAGVTELLENKINSIELLPFFGAGTMEDEGYFLVPDGTGALIHYNSGKTAAKSYEQSLFGFDNGTNDRVMDPVKALKTTFTFTENGLLPVFGVKCEEDGFLAVITDGAAKATVMARVAGKYTSYNTIWTAYDYRSVGTVRLMQKEMTEQTTSIAEKHPDTATNYTIEFHFMDHGKAEYSDMAGFYREYLIETAGLTKRTAEGDIPFYLNLYGYIRKTKSFLGIPKDTKIATTTIEDAEEITRLLQAEGIGNIVMKYNYWMKDGYYEKIQTGAKVERKIGSAKKMKALQQQLEENGGSLYPAADLMNIYKTGNGVSKFSNVLNSVANTPQMQRVFNLDVAMPDTRYEPWYLVRMLDLPGYMNTFLENFTKYGYTNAAFDAIGTMAYSDLSSSGLSRSRVPQVISDTLTQAEETLRGIMLTGANSFAAVHATHILEVPTGSSNFDIVDEDVPFYQMVFHGYLYYSGGVVNLTSNPEDTILRCLEYGASPEFSWVARNMEELLGSRTNNLFSPDYDKWLDYAAEKYNELNEVLKDTVTLPITGHKNIQDRVAMTTYGDRITIFVNYNDTEAVYENYRIPAKGYLVVAAK